MSSGSSVTSIPTAQVGDSQVANYQLSHVGSVYRAALAAVADGETQGLAIDAFGRQIIIGPTPEGSAFIQNPMGIGGIYRAILPTYGDGEQVVNHHDINGRMLARVSGDAADNDPVSGNPVRIGGAYNATLPTYGNGDQATLQQDVNGRLLTKGQGVDADNAPTTANPLLGGSQYNSTPPTYGDGDTANLQSDVNGNLKTRDVVLDSLDRNAGAVTANTLRTQPTNEALNNVYQSQGPAADNAAAAGNPLRSGGVYNSSLPTYDDGDIGSVQLDQNGRQLVADQNVANLSKDSGASDANTLRTELTTESLNNPYIVRGGEADNAAATSNPVGVGGIHNTALPTYGNGDRTTHQADANGRLHTRPDGGVADNAADSGNPLKVGAVYESSLPTYDDGDRTTVHTDVNGRVLNDVEGRPVEDTAFSAGDRAHSMMTRRQDAIVEDSSADNDYQMVKSDNKGAIHVTSKDSAYLDVVDQLDAGVLDSASTNIPASATPAPVTVVASLAARARKIKAFDTTGFYIGLYSDPSGTPVLEAILGPGMDGDIEVDIPAGTELGLRHMKNAVVDLGDVAINFMG